jgi:hypothetical protein
MVMCVCIYIYSIYVYIYIYIYTFMSVNMQALWDFESCTVFRYPWAREGLAMERIGEDEGLRVVEKSTGNTLVQLTYASYRYCLMYQQMQICMSKMQACV